MRNHHEGSMLPLLAAIGPIGLWIRVRIKEKLAAKKGASAAQEPPR